jgi:hypothetical protein
MVVAPGRKRLKDLLQILPLSRAFVQNADDLRDR